MKPIVDRIREEDELPKKRAYDVVLPAAAVFIALVVTVLLFGITMLYSTSFGTDGTMYLYKQFQWAIVGFMGFFAALILGYKRVSDWSLWLMIVICILLLIADFSPAVKGAHRWIKIPKIGNIQPSEYAKVIISLFLAKILSDGTTIEPGDLGQKSNIRGKQSPLPFGYGLGGDPQMLRRHLLGHFVGQTQFFQFVFQFHIHLRICFSSSSYTFFVSTEATRSDSTGR